MNWNQIRILYTRTHLACSDLFTHFASLSCLRKRMRGCLLINQTSHLSDTHVSKHPESRIPSTKSKAESDQIIFACIFNASLHESSSISSPVSIRMIRYIALGLGLHSPVVKQMHSGSFTVLVKKIYVMVESRKGETEQSLIDFIGYCVCPW